MHRMIPLLALALSATACDDGDGGGSNIPDGLYTVEARLQGPCGAPVEVSECPDCVVSQPLVEIKTESFGSLTGRFISTCETADNCFLVAGLEGTKSSQTDAQQQVFSNGDTCHYSTLDFAMGAAEGEGFELSFLTYEGDIQSDDCLGLTDDPPPRSALTCTKEEIARIKAR